MSIKDAIKNGETVIPFSEEVTIYDIMYISTMKIFTIHPDFGEFVELNDYGECIAHMVISRQLPDLLILLYAVMTNNSHDSLCITNTYDDDNDHVFADGFLENCWKLACENNLEHQLFGNIIKKLGYSPKQDFSYFKMSYLGELPNIKSARKI